MARPSKSDSFRLTVVRYYVRKFFITLFTQTENFVDIFFLPPIIYNKMLEGVKNFLISLPFLLIFIIFVIVSILNWGKITKWWASKKTIPPTFNPNRSKPKPQYSRPAPTAQTPAPSNTAVGGLGDVGSDF